MHGHKPKPGAPSAAASARGVLGTGLGAPAVAGILVASTAVFLLWDVPLWRASARTSHVGRIAISYLVILPLVGGALLLARRWSAGRWLSGVALLWGAKLVITASLYYYVVPSTAEHYAPARNWETQRRAPAAPRIRYRAAAQPTGLVDVSGVITSGGAPIAGAAVWVDRPPPGLPLAGRPLAWTIRGGQHDAAVRIATTADTITVANADAMLHTLRFTAQGRALWNVPVPAGATGQTVATPPAGSYQLSCENHNGERATLVVVDHPYITLTDAAGGFELAGVPGTATEISIASPAGHNVVRPIPASPGAAVDIGDQPNGGDE